MSLYLCVFEDNDNNQPYASFSNTPAEREEKILAQIDFSGNRTIGAMSIMIDLARDARSEYEPIEEILNKLLQVGIEIGKNQTR